MRASQPASQPFDQSYKQESLLQGDSSLGVTYKGLKSPTTAVIGELAQFCLHQKHAHILCKAVLKLDVMITFGSTERVMEGVCNFGRHALPKLTADSVSCRDEPCLQSDAGGNHTCNQDKSKPKAGNRADIFLCMRQRVTRA